MHSLHVGSRISPELDVQQAQGLRTCSGAFKSSPVAAVQAEMGEQPLRIRRLKIMLAHWVNIKGHGASHPAKAILKDCCEHESTNVNSFGWIRNVVAEQAGLDQIQSSAKQSLCQKFLPVHLSVIPCGVNSDNNSSAMDQGAWYR